MAYFDADKGIIRTESGYEIVGHKTGGVYIMSDWEALQSGTPAFTTYALALQLRTPVSLWHQRLGHLGKGNLKRLLTEDMVTGINIKTIDWDSIDECCDPCRKGRMTRPAFQSSTTEVSGPLDLIHMDLCGPLEETRGGNKYIATFKDDYSSYSWIQLTSSKQNLADVIKKQFALLETETGRKIKAVKTDNGREYISTALEDYLQEKGIKHNISMPYTPQQNGEAERLNRTLQEKARPMLSQASLPLNMWGEAVTVANYMRNVSPVTGDEDWGCGL